MKVFSAMLSTISASMIVAIAVISLPVYAVEIQNVPNPRTSQVWVTDMENILSPETEAQINRMITELEAKNGTEIVVVTVPNTAPSATPKEFTTALFNYWKIGKKDIDNGVLFMISKGDRRVEIETGYGIEDILPDAKVGAIIDQKIIPEFKKGDFETGILNGTQGLILELSPARFPLEKTILRNSDFLWQWGKIIGGLGLFSGGFYKFLTRRRYIEPFGESQVSGGRSRPIHCRDCKQAMVRVDDALVLPRLTEIQKFSLLTKGIEVQGWHCPNCSPIDTENVDFHLLIQILVWGWKECSECHGETVDDQGKIIVTKHSSSEKCRYCKHLLLQPQGISKWSQGDLSTSTLMFCRDCKQEMIQVDENILSPQLSDVEKFAQVKKYTEIQGWQCPSCPVEKAEEISFHKLTHVLRSDSLECPQCGGDTMFSESHTVRSPTYESSGLGETVKTCEYCHHQERQNYIIAKLTPPSSSSSSSGDFGGGGGSSDSDSGGGSSGGGGAGGSW